MYSLGYRRIGLVLDLGSLQQRGDLLRAGVLCEHDRLPQAARVPPLILSTSASSVRNWVSQYKVDAILAEQTTYQQVVDVIGRTKAKELGWACTDVAGAAPDIAGIIIDYEALGSVAVEQVVSLLKIHQRGFAREVSMTFVPVAWKDGGSLPKKNAS